MAYLLSEQMLYICRNKLCDHSEVRSKFYNGLSVCPEWEEKVVCPSCGGLNLYKATTAELLGLEEQPK